MAFIRKRGQTYSVCFKWKGKPHIKAVGAEHAEAERIKVQVEEQLKRIRKGDSLLASQLLAEGFPIMDVLFGSPQVALRIGRKPTDADQTSPAPATDEVAQANPLSLKELADQYLADLRTTAGSDHLYATEMWSKTLRRYLGDDRAVMSLTLADLEEYRKKRVGPSGERTTITKREMGTLKAAITWAIDRNLLTASPITRWPRFRTSPQKRFEWKADIQEIVRSQSFRTEKDRRDFLSEMSARLVLTSQDMQSLVELAKGRMTELTLPLMLVCSTGTRRKEMVMLRKHDFDPKRGTIIVGSGKQSRAEEVTYRTIVLPQQVAADLAVHANTLPRSERMLFPIFKEPNGGRNNRWIEWEKKPDGSDKRDERGRRIPKKGQDGKPVVSRRKQAEARLRCEKASRMLRRLVEGTEFELMNGWHSLRHSFISICVAKGLTWEQIAEWVGHVNPKTTRLYTHFNIADSKRRMESLEIKF